MNRDSVPTLPPDAAPDLASEDGDFEDDTDVDGSLRRAKTAVTALDEEEDTIPTLPPEAAELSGGRRDVASWAPTTTEIIELSGDLITRQVAEEWRAAAHEEFERRVADGVPPEQAAEEAIAKYLPMAREPDTF